MKITKARVGLATALAAGAASYGIPKYESAQQAAQINDLIHRVNGRDLPKQPANSVGDANSGLYQDASDARQLTASRIRGMKLSTLFTYSGEVQDLALFISDSTGASPSTVLGQVLPESSVTALNARDVHFAYNWPGKCLNASGIRIDGVEESFFPLTSAPNAQDGIYIPASNTQPKGVNYTIAQ